VALQRALPECPKAMPEKDDDLGDVYELLGVDEEAGDKDIQGAFRKGSLKCHPDRNPDDPEAAEKFDRLTRAKELLLDATRRAEYDRKRKAKRDLEERYAKEDETRRKLREKLEGGEAAAAAKSASASAAVAANEARQRYLRADLASRIRAKEAELAERHAGVAAEAATTAAKARSHAEEAQVRVRWRDAKGAGGKEERVEAIKKVLGEFDLHTIALEGELEALVQLGSREEALRAVLSCRERRHQLGFRVVMEGKEKRAKAQAPWEPAPEEEAAAPAKKRPKVGAAGPSAQPPDKPGKGAPAKSSFDDWEAKMLESLAGMVAAQKKSAPTA